MFQGCLGTSTLRTKNFSQLIKADRPQIKKSEVKQEDDCEKTVLGCNTKVKEQRNSQPQSSWRALTFGVCLCTPVGFSFCLVNSTDYAKRMLTIISFKRKFIKTHKNVETENVRARSPLVKKNAMDACSIVCIMPSCLLYYSFHSIHVLLRCFIHSVLKLMPLLGYFSHFTSFLSVPFVVHI